MQAVGIIQMLLQLIIYSSEQKVLVLQMNEVHISFTVDTFLIMGIFTKLTAMAPLVLPTPGLHFK